CAWTTTCRSTCSSSPRAISSAWRPASGSARSSRRRRATANDNTREGGVMGAIEDFLADCEVRMDKSIEMTRTEFNSVRTGRASAALLDRITIDYYGTPTPLSNMATISAPEARLLSIQPYDATQIKTIEKAIMESDLGLTPSNDGKLIRLPIPALTEERRKELVKLVRNGDVGDDEERRAEAQVQKLTDDHVKRIDELLKHKEAEILEV